MIIQNLIKYFVCLAFLLASPLGNANETVTTVKLQYLEKEEGVEPYSVIYIASSNYLRIDDETDSSGYIIYDRKENKIYSVSHYDQSILVIPQYLVKDFKPAFEIDVGYNALDDAPTISGKKVYNYRVSAVTTDKSDTCMDIQLVPGLLPEVAKMLQEFQLLVSGQHVSNLENTPDEFQTPCYLVDQVYNKGDYYSKGLPVQEWHSNGKMRQLINFEDSEVDTAIFEIPQEYRQYSLK